MDKLVCDWPDANKHYRFAPDLVVEITAVCDRRCAGCYAPNLVTKAPVDQIYRDRPALFLTPEDLRQALDRVMDKKDGEDFSISLRGGEPSRHPQFIQLVETAAGIASDLYVETHGYWINDNSAKESLRKLAAAGATIKVSFDRMHGLSSTRLSAMIDILDRISLRWLVAITEETAVDFARTRGACAFVADRQIVLQRKAKWSDLLLRPRFGVITVDGKFTPTLTNNLPKMGKSS